MKKFFLVLSIITFTFAAYSQRFTGDATKIGVNGFHWVPESIVDHYPKYRMYQMLEWTWTVDGLALEPTRQANGNYDTYLQGARDHGIEVVFCPNLIPSWMVNQDPNNWGDWMSQRLHRPGADPTDPQSYKEIGQYYWQLAARYGKVRYQDTLLWINQIPRWTNDPVTLKMSGMDLLKYIEIENEPDRPWKDPQYKYTPEQYACLLSVAYDGHEGTVKGAGIKTADPTMQVVCGGLSYIAEDYLEAMMDWFKTHRKDGKFPADVINVHHYCNSSNPPSGPINLVNGSGISPEEDNLKVRLIDLKRWCSKNCPFANIWFSEFGYDTVKPGNPVLSQYPKLYGNHDAEDLQSIWLVRTFLEMISAKIDAGFVYNVIDEQSSASGNLFASCGLYTSEHSPSPFTPKPGAVAINSFINALNGYVYFRDYSTKSVRCYTFKGKNSIKYFFWSPTSNDAEIPFKINGKDFVAEETVKIYTQKGRFPIFKKVR